MLRRPGAKPILQQYCQDMAEKIIQSLTESNEADLFAQQLEIIFHLLSRFADVQKAAKRAAKRERLRQLGDKNQVVFLFLAPIRKLQS